MNFGPKFEQGLRLMLEAVADAQNHATAPLTPDGMTAELAEIAALRGRPAFYPYLGAGVGRGARAMLADGRAQCSPTDAGCSISRSASACICSATATSI